MCTCLRRQSQQCVPLFYEPVLSVLFSMLTLMISWRREQAFSIDCSCTRHCRGSAVEQSFKASFTCRILWEYVISSTPLLAFLLALYEVQNLLELFEADKEWDIFRLKPFLAMNNRWFSQIILLMFSYCTELWSSLFSVLYVQHYYCTCNNFFFAMRF